MRGTLVLDLDGTLVDSVPDLATALNRLMASRGLAPFAFPEVALMVGDGAQRYGGRLAGGHDVELAGDDFSYPSARSLVRLAHARALREEWVNPGDIEPMYLRKPDAEINWSSRDGA